MANVAKQTTAGITKRHDLWINLFNEYRKKILVISMKYIWCINDIHVGSLFATTSTYHYKYNPNNCHCDFNHRIIIIIWTRFIVAPFGVYFVDLFWKLDKFGSVFWNFEKWWNINWLTHHFGRNQNHLMESTVIQCWLFRWSFDN